MLSRLFAGSSLFVALALAACSSTPSSAPSESSGNPGSSGGSPKISSSECSTRCDGKATKCGAPSSQVEQICAQLCGESLTEAEISCLEEATCNKLEKAVKRGESLAEVIDLACVEDRSKKPGDPSNPGNVDELPTSLTITGKFGSVEATHILGDDKKTLASVLSLAPKPSFNPSQPRELPMISSKDVKATVASPSLGNCKVSINYVLNSQQIGVVISGVDTLPDGDCATFTDKVAEGGFKATLESVPYPNASTKATVTIDLKP